MLRMVSAPRKLTKEEAKRAQEAAGALLLLARAAGSAALHSLSELACAQPSRLEALEERAAACA